MTPREAAISLLEDAANSQGGGLLTRRQHHESIMSHLQREEQLHKAALDWAKSMPASILLESTTVDHDGDCNLLNGAGHAGCNCTAMERQKLRTRVTELESERDDFKRALDDLGVTPGEARNGAARSRERVARMAELEDANKRMHGMIMSIRDHVGAYNTPTDPADIDIIKCVTDKYDKLQESVEDLESENENLQIEHDVMFARIRDNNSQYTPEEVSRLIDSEILVHRIAEQANVVAVQAQAVQGAHTQLKEAAVVIDRQMDRIAELETNIQKYELRCETAEKTIRWNRSTDWGNDSANYYRDLFEKEFEISKKHLDKIRALEQYIKERSSPLFVVSPVELSEEDMVRLKAAMNTQMPIEIVPLGMTIHGMTQLVCGELPENYQIHIHMENGYGEAILYFPTQEPPYDGSLDGSTLADANIEKQIVELVKLAKGEPSEYDPEQP